MRKVRAGGLAGLSDSHGVTLGEAEMPASHNVYSNHWILCFRTYRHARYLLCFQCKRGMFLAKLILKLPKGAEVNSLGTNR